MPEMKLPHTSPHLSAPILIAVAVGAFFAGVGLGGFALPAQSSLNVVGGIETPPPDADLSPFYKAWRLLELNYVPPTPTATPSVEERVFGAVGGLAASYKDPYTTFLPPQVNRIFTEDLQGSFAGIGIHIGIRDGVLTVISPLKGTPAARAGLRPGDRIIEVNGSSTQDWTLDQAVLAIRGKEGTKVTLTIVREGVPRPFTVTLTRARIEIPTVEYTYRPAERTAIIALANFGGTSVPRFREAFRSFLQSPARALIIDLRGNPGGFLDAAVEIASYFLPMGEVVVTGYRGEGKPPIVHRSRGYDLVRRVKPGAKVFVLIDRGSASASEILAGALQDHRVATVVGERSFGKGSVQELFPLTKDTSLKITVAHWRTPRGRNISHNGIEPDIVVVVKPEDIDAGRDRIMERVLEEVRKLTP